MTMHVTIVHENVVSMSGKHKRTKEIARRDTARYIMDETNAMIESRHERTTMHDSCITRNTSLSILESATPIPYMIRYRS